MMLYPDCSHVICARCQHEQPSVPNVDGSPGCCVKKCFNESLIDRVPNATYRKEALYRSNPFTAITYNLTDLSEVIYGSKANSEANIIYRILHSVGYC
ncbi:unnamed protein product [Strongylus vulgaris]|uniref:Uncharacterized protein n=1 Tax=Strongylus vulgaris TaxID=40348 RepID=A0A3P7L428_STRVU|nr:unnamed protein product [Strongylus vulgaris]